MLLLLVVGLTILEPVFLTPRNIGNVLAQTAVICVLAMGQLLVIVTRGVDLSVGATVALASVVGALAFGHVDAGLAIVAVMLATGLTVGLVNGVVYVWGRMPHPFIVTLATLSVARGLALWLADGRSTIPGGMPDLIRSLGSASIGFVPVSASSSWRCSRCVIAVFSKRMVWGRWIFAVGGNPEAARRAAIPVSWVLASVYALSGLLAGVGAVLASGRSNGGIAQLRAARGARLDRRRRHRRRQLPGRPRQRRQRARGRADDRRHPQRHEPAQRRRVRAADRDRRRHRGGGRDGRACGARSRRGCGSCGRPA